MGDFDLQALAESELYGDWVVFRRLGNLEQNTFLHSALLRFQPGNLFQTGDGARGTWCTFKETELIYQPQLSIEVDGHPKAHAIITRLYLIPGPPGLTKKLTLYFTSGLELMLETVSLDGRPEVAKDGKDRPSA